MSESVITYYNQLEGMAKQAIEKYGGTACAQCTKPTCCWQRLLVYGSDGRERDAWIVDAESSVDAKQRGERKVRNSKTLPPDDYTFRVHRCTAAGHRL